MLRQLDHERSNKTIDIRCGDGRPPFVRPLGNTIAHNLFIVQETSKEQSRNESSRSERGMNDSDVRSVKNHFARFSVYERRGRHLARQRDRQGAGNTLSLRLQANVNR